MNLNGITDPEIIRIELLNRARAAGTRQVTVRGVELIAAVTGIHPANVKFITQPQEQADPVAVAEEPPAAPTDPEQKQTKPTRSKRTRTRKQK